MRIESLPPDPNSEFCFPRIEAKSVYTIVAYEWLYRPENGFFAPISGATSSTITASKSGEYVLKVTDANGLTALSGQVGFYFGGRYRPIIMSVKTVICPNGTTELVF